MTTFFFFATSQTFIWIYCSWIAVVFATTLARWLHGWFVLRDKLAKVDEPLAGLNAKSFPGAFESYSKTAKRCFPTAWQRYRDTLVLPDAPAAGTEDQGAFEPVTSATNASLHLNETTILGPHLSIHSFSAIPNVLTGLGILGTFLGLAGGIGLATAGITSPDTGAIRDSLSSLLGGAALAFVTSIVGVLLSIVFLVVLRLTLRSIGQRINQWADKLDTLVELRTPTYFAQQQLKEARKASTSLQSFATDLAVAIGEKTGPHFDELLTELRALRTDRATDSGRVIKDALEDFAEVLSKQAGGQFDTLSATVAELNTSLTASARQLEETQRSVSDTMKSLVAEMETSMNRNASTMSDEIRTSLTDAAEAIAAALAHAGKSASANLAESSMGLQTAAQQLTRSTEQSEQLLNQLSRSASDFDRLHATMGETQERIAAVAHPVLRATEAVQEAVSQAAQTLAGTEGLVERIQSSVEQIEQHGQSVTQVWSKYQERFEDVDQSLARVFKSLSESLASYCNQVTEFAETLDTTAGEAIGKLSAATGELKEVVEEWLDAMVEEDE